MTLLVQLLLACVLLSIIVGVGWRFFSRRASLPCPPWLAWMVELENPLARNHNASAIIQRLSLQPGMSVLDAGCGPGRLTIPLARAVGPTGTVVAVDLQSRMLDRAKQKASVAGLSNIEFRETALGGGSLESERFDRAVLVTVLGEIPDKRAALLELGRALKPEGILSVTEIILDPHFQSRSTLRTLAEGAGLQEKAFCGNTFAFTAHLEKA